MMPFSQYCRIETKAGGAFCSDRAFIRAAHSLLTDNGKARDMRAARHAWIREGLAMLRKSKRQAIQLGARP